VGGGLQRHAVVICDKSALVIGILLHWPTARWIQTSAYHFQSSSLIRDTPRSHQSPNTRGKELWKRKVGDAASAHLKTLRDFFFIDRRALAATIFYFPPGVMAGDVDNIVKLIVDGMVTIVYPDDQLLERIVVQKFEPGVEAVFQAPTMTLERAIEMEPPVIYVRIDDDLSWRQVQ
jgi:crossover junction endodeoxyribonuclease RusA